MKAAVSLAAAALLACALAVCDNMGRRTAPPDTPGLGSFRGRRLRAPSARAVAHGNWRQTTVSDAGGDELEMPVPLTHPGLVRARGRVMFDAQCAPCHGEDGPAGHRRPARLPPPPSLHEERIRRATDGRLFASSRVATGYVRKRNRLPPPTAGRCRRLRPRAFQRSQHATLADVPEGERPEAPGP